MDACEHIRRLLCGGIDVSDFFVPGAPPTPAWVRDLARRPPTTGPRGSIAWDGHLGEVFRNRRIVPRQYFFSWDFAGGSEYVTDIEADEAVQLRRLGSDQELLVSAYRWDWSGFPVSPFPAPVVPLDPEVSNLYTPLRVLYGTQDVKVTDRAQNITCCWGSPRCWAYPPRTRLYRRGAVLQFQAAIDWSYAIDPDPEAPPFVAPATRLDVVLDVLELYPRSA